jgi:hypothetical protein
MTPSSRNTAGDSVPYRHLVWADSMKGMRACLHERCSYVFGQSGFHTPSGGPVWCQPLCAAKHANMWHDTRDKHTGWHTGTPAWAPEAEE